jgi:hypothetical protein
MSSFFSNAVTTGNKRCREANENLEMLFEKLKESRTGCSQLPWGCHVNIGGRPYQEDCHVAACQLKGSPHVMFGVFDGHGGSQVSAFLAENSVAYVTNALSECNEEASMQDVLKDAFVALDNSLPKSTSGRDLGGSTAVIVLLSEENIVCANCGKLLVSLFLSVHPPNLCLPTSQVTLALCSQETVQLLRYQRITSLKDRMKR